MGLRSIAKRFATPVEELDRENLRAFCAERGQTCSIAELEPRQEVVVIGEIASLRVVPRDGSPWLEATMTDGSEQLTVMWTGRRAIPGIAPGRRLVVEGRAMPMREGSRRLKLLNPRYELLAAPGGH
jgi:RecG-like helicase